VVNQSNAEDISYSRPLSRCAGIAVIKEFGSNEVTNNQAETIADRLLQKRYSEGIEAGFKQGLTELGTEQIKAVKFFKPYQDDSSDGDNNAPRVCWPVYHGYFPTGNRGEYYEISSRFAIVVCRQMLGSKLWTTTRLASICQKEGNSFKPVLKRFNSDHLSDYMERITQIAQHVLELTFPYYRDVVSDVVKREVHHKQWLLCEGANTSRMIIDYEQEHATVRKSQVFVIFKNDLYHRLTGLHNFNGSLKDLSDFLSNMPVRTYKYSHDVGFITIGPPIENSFISCEKNIRRHLPVYRLFGLASCLYPSVFGPEYDPFMIISKRETEFYSHCF